MLNERIEKALNDQVQKEGFSSNLYLAMASWAEVHDLDGAAQFLYAHSDEERQHMLKLIRYINERGGHAMTPQLNQPPVNFDSLQKVFESLLEHEIQVTASINDIVGLCLEVKDYSTHNFMQWYVSEQIEEEALARTILGKLDMIGNDKGGLYLFDRDLEKLSVMGDPNATQ